MSGLHVMQITAQSLSPNGKLVATGTETLNKDSALNPYSKEWDVIDNKDPVRVWDVVGGNLVREFGPLRGAVKALAFNPDGSLLLSCQTDLEKKETLWLWDVASGDLVERISTPRSGHEFFGCAISPNGQSIAMPVRDQIYLVNLQQ
jgi:WD40 repeat protein